MNFSVLAMVFLLLSLQQPNVEGTTRQTTALGVCQILVDAPSHNGRLVQIRGRFHRDLESKAIEEEGCEGRILVVDPAHPSIHPRPDFRIKDDMAWREFEKVSEETQWVQTILPTS
jgi:hypothetical protein